jgi:hypothetical protein
MQMLKSLCLALGAQHILPALQQLSRGMVACLVLGRRKAEHQQHDRGRRHRSDAGENERSPNGVVSHGNRGDTDAADDRQEQVV